MSWTKLENDMTFQNGLVCRGRVRRCIRQQMCNWGRQSSKDFNTEGGGADAVLTEAIVRIRSGSLQSNDYDWMTGQPLER